MATAKNNARMTDIDLLIQAGIDPKTGLPYRSGAKKADLKPDLRRSFRIMDEQDAVNKYTWYNLPKGLNAHLIERILYYKGQGAFFYMPSNETFYFLPYTLSGSIDMYGRFTSITPLVFNGSTTSDGKDKVWIDNLILTPKYDIILPEDLTLNDFETSCVLLHDYTQQISQTNIPRQQLQEPILNVMSNCIPFMNTSLLNSTGVTGIRVNGQEGAQNVLAASQALECAALTGEKYIPIVNEITMQDLSGSNVASAEQFLLALQSLDNLRLSMHGLENGGLFQKKAHMLEAEQRMNNGNIGLILQDGLRNRQEFCDIINSIWGLGMWCEVSETVSGIDRDFDGELSDETNNTDKNENLPQEETNNVTE